MVLTSSLNSSQSNRLESGRFMAVKEEPTDVLGTLKIGPPTVGFMHLTIEAFHANECAGAHGGTL